MNHSFKRGNRRKALAALGMVLGADDKMMIRQAITPEVKDMEDSKERRLQFDQTEYTAFGVQNKDTLSTSQGAVNLNAISAVAPITSGVASQVQAMGIAVPSAEQRVQILEDQVRSLAAVLKTSLPSGTAALVEGLLVNVAKELSYIKQEILNIRNKNLQGTGNPPLPLFHPDVVPYYPTPYPNIGPGQFPPDQWKPGTIYAYSEDKANGELIYNAEMTQKLYAAANAVVKNG